MERTIERFREFNRRWTALLGLLDQGLLETEHSLTEARVIFELAQRGDWERLDLRNRLGIDQSFLGRVLGRLEAGGLIEIAPSTHDGRRRTVRLTAAGRTAYETLDQRSTEQVTAIIEPMTPDQRAVLTEAMSVITALVRPDPDRRVTLRGLRPGDLGWVVKRHGEIYWDEYRWDSSFEALVARIVADHHVGHAPGRERAWVADVDGVRAGCIFCCEKDADTAQLRLLLVEPWGRGMGVGGRLVDDCVAFARSAGYLRMTLWTNDVLVSARRIYEARGFELVAEDHHHSFGHDLVGQTWDLDLTVESGA